MEVRRILLWSACLIGFAGCDLPRDPKGTTQRMRNGVLRVGIVHSPPWTIVDADATDFSGVEVELVRQLATELGAQVEWFPGGESPLMEALRRFELDFVIGGLSRRSPWNGRVALTRPYFETRLTVGKSTLENFRHVMAAPPGENGWLLLVDTVLEHRRTQIEELLQDHEDHVSHAHN